MVCLHQATHHLTVTFSFHPRTHALDAVAHQSTHKTYRNTTVSSSSLKWFPCFVIVTTSDNLMGAAARFGIAFPSHHDLRQLHRSACRTTKGQMYNLILKTVSFILSSQIQNRKRYLHLKLYLPSVFLLFFISWLVKPLVKPSCDN